jgi:hypothetical protein
MALVSPYKNLPDTAFWRRAVAALAPLEVDPVTDVPFTIAPGDSVATAGSCFAQHISKTLVRLGFNYLVTETGPQDRNYGVFPSRFGNIYTVRQLLQLFDRAYGLLTVADNVWVRDDGMFVDPLRPQVEASGFVTKEALLSDQAKHLGTVREMFEQCDVFIFTLGLTEGWQSLHDRVVVPLAPGTVGYPVDDAEYEFINFGVAEMVSDLETFIRKLRIVNPGVKVLLTVSPVPLVATYAKRHVLVSTVASKSALRVVADMVSQSVKGVAYFPSYEIITGPHHGHRFMASDLREVTADGVDHVMGIFARHYMSDAIAPQTPKTPQYLSNMSQEKASEDLYDVVCDELVLDR